MENSKYIYLWNNSNIIMLNFDDLKPYKLFHLIGEDEEYKKLYL